MARAIGNRCTPACPNTPPAPPARLRLHPCTVALCQRRGNAAKPRKLRHKLAVLKEQCSPEALLQQGLWLGVAVPAWLGLAGDGTVRVRQAGQGLRQA